jgi:HK97 family phage portal protein
LAQTIKRSWGQRILSKAVQPFGYDIVPSRAAQLRKIDSLFKIFGLSVVFGKWDEKDYVSQGFAANAGLYSVVTRITKTAAVPTFSVYRIKDKKKHYLYKQYTGENATPASLQKAQMMREQVYELDETHPLNQLIEQPNPWQSWNNFMQTSVGFRLLTGNKFWYVQTLDMGANRGKPIAIFNLPPQCMQLVVGDTLWSVVGYKMHLNKTLDIPPESVIHSMYPNYEYDGTGSHLMGMSPLRPGSRNLDRVNSAEDRGVAMLRNAGAAAIVYAKEGWTGTDGGELSLEQAADMKRKFNEDVLGTGNAGKIALANQELGMIDFSHTAQEMGLIEIEKFSDQKICNIYHVPYVLQNPDFSSYNNIKEAKKELITMAVLPELNYERDDWNRIAKMYGDEKIYVDYNLNCYPEMQEDQGTLAAILEKSPYLTYNEKRLARGYDQDDEEPMMNKYLVPSGLVDISDLNPDNLDNEMNAVDEEEGTN